ncbi:NAD(P)/FAD-dependent oxidoreductase [Paralcaligenes ureilyticus]|uniref:NADH dehydrogenase n=1 Tax=Paralcaligenes ureilyticus TaxID=627131 RepID=A0A4R3MDC7_9BURK|nr:FAD-dependent oxidoreductase [Paralcaligenes ureilyticus]TCT10067.1 NADH dehydrogenase [Paralcaligenes ureilyticus]
MTAALHKIVIVGGGAGGLELAAKLGRKFGPAHVVLVDRAAYHIWKPSLHEVAAGTLDIHREGLSYFMLAKDCGFTFALGEMAGVDLTTKNIRLNAVLDPQQEEVFPAREIAYDTLVLAVGSKSNFFSTAGAGEFALTIDSTEQAERFRLKLLHTVARLNRDKNGSSDRALQIAIVGAGATGVELAAELTQAFSEMASYGLDNFDPSRDVKISLLEGASRILSALPEKISAAAHQLLLDRGIAVKTSVRIASVGADALHDVEGGRFPADLCVWAAGIEAPVFLSQLGLASNRNHQLIVDAGLRASDPDVYALGDCAEAAWGSDGKFIPARAQAAHQQASFLCGVLADRIQERDVPTRIFKYKDYGSLISVGHNRAVGRLMGVLAGRGLFVEGLFARFMYMSLHLMHHLAFLGLVRTTSLAVGRLLLKRGAPRVKLH